MLAIISNFKLSVKCLSYGCVYECVSRRANPENIELRQIVDAASQALQDATEDRLSREIVMPACVCRLSASVAPHFDSEIAAFVSLARKQKTISLPVSVCLCVCVSMCLQCFSAIDFTLSKSHTRIHTRAY